MPGPTSKVLYNMLNAQYGSKFGTYDQFTKKLYDVGARKAFYDNLQKVGVNPGTWSHFNNEMGYAPGSPYYQSPDGSGYDSATGLNVPPPAKNAHEAVSQDVGGAGHFLENIYNHLASASVKMLASAAEMANLLPSITQVTDITTPLAEAKATGTGMAGFLKDYGEQKGSEEQAIGSAMDKVTHAVITNNAAELDKYYSWKGGSLAQKAGALFGGLADMAPSLLTAAPTLGGSFVLANFSDAMKESQKKGLNFYQAAGFSTLYSAIMAGMNEIPILGKVSGKFADRALNKFAENRAVNLITDWVEKNPGKQITAETMSKMLADAKTGVGARFAQAGYRIAYSTPTALATGAVGEGAIMGLKKLTNMTDGKEVFKTDDFDSKEFWKGVGNVLLMNTVFHGVSGLLDSTTGRYIKDHLANGENADKIKQELDSSSAFNKLSDQSKVAIKEGLDDMAYVNSKIPKDIPKFKRLKLMEYAYEKRQAQKLYDAKIEEANGSEDAIKTQKTQEANRVKNAMPAFDDLSEELLTDKKYEYKETKNEDGTSTYTKNFEGEKPIDINQDHYDYAVGRRKKNDELVESSKNEPSDVWNTENKNPFEGSMLFTEENKKEETTTEQQAKPTEPAKTEPEEKDTFLQEMNDMQFDSYVKDLKEERTKLEKERDKNIADGNTASAKRKQLELGVNQKMEDFTTKHKAKIEDVIDTLKKLGELAVDCKGRQHTIRTGGNT